MSRTEQHRRYARMGLRTKAFVIIVLKTLALVGEIEFADARPPERATAKPRVSPETTMAEKLADELVAALAGKGPFRWDRCPNVAPTDWASLLLLNDGIPIKYAFEEGCDVEGDTVLRRTPFPVDLKLRNFPGAERLKATVEAEAKPDWANGVVRAEVRFRDATLEGNGTSVAFTLALRVATGLDTKSLEPVVGELRIYRVRNQDVDVRRKIP
jgi:hypothetical protein